jgi:succinate-semialdehyde dehydrogenase / glutarate-semialdehyde dehydrogenase
VLQACFSSTGQLCISAERLYVHESLYETFLAEFAAATEALVMNARYDFSAHVGSLVSEEQLEKVTEHVEDARQQGPRWSPGATPARTWGRTSTRPPSSPGSTRTWPCTARRPSGRWRRSTPSPRTRRPSPAPTTRSTASTRASGRATSRQAARIAERLECGTVSVNDAYVSAWGSTAAPMGGFKASGLGRRHGPEGLLKFTEPQTVSVQLFGPLAADHLGVTQEAFAEVTRHALRLLRHLPGLR